MTLSTINPATGVVITNYQTMTEQNVSIIIDQCYQDFLLWAKESFDARSKKMLNVAETLLSNKDKYAAIITAEMGKTLKSAVAEIEKCSWACRHFAENTENYLTPRLIKTDMSKSYVTYNPLGIILGIMPWNFPFWQVFRFAAPAIMAGNAVLLKHAAITTGCGLIIETLFKESGFPPNLFRTLVIENDFAAKVIQHPKISAITVTGSDRTGKTIAGLAGSSLKKIVLELGGSDPYIILEDADLDVAADSVLTSRMNNTGQSCIAAKRILAVQAIRDPFQKKILQKLDKYTMGNPTEKNVNIGPLARADLRDHLHRQVQESIEKGAKLLTGGTIPEKPGFFYPITVLIHVKNGMPAYEEELFGPVITFIDVTNEKEAIAIANDTKYALAAAIFTQDIKRGEKIAVEEINAGTVFVNDFVRSDPRLPFGGMKESGFGRELSEEGMKEFVNIKTIAIK